MGSKTSKHPKSDIVRAVAKEQGMTTKNLKLARRPKTKELLGAITSPLHDKSQYLDGKAFCKRFGKGKWGTDILVWDADANKAVPAKEHPYIQMRMKVERGEILDGGNINFSDYDLFIAGEKTRRYTLTPETQVWCLELDRVVPINEYPYVIKARASIQKRNQELLLDPNLSKYKGWLFELCTQVLKANKQWKEKPRRARPFHPLMMFHPMFGPRMMDRDCDWDNDFGDFDDRLYKVNINSAIENWYDSELISNPEKRLEVIREALGKMSSTEKVLLNINKLSSDIDKEYVERTKPPV